MGFLDAIIRDWDGKSDTPELHRRIERARYGWVKTKAELVSRGLKEGYLTAEDAARQLTHVERMSHLVVSKALKRRFEAAPPEGGGVQRLPRKTDESQ